jgi:hypothetical protein
LIKWREPRGIGLRYVSPDIELGAPNVNAEIHLNLGIGRWILLCGGPRLGPAVLFWSLLFVVLLTALCLGRVQLTPLRTLQWMLLGIGLTQVPLVASAIFVGWLLVLGWRSRTPELPRVWFNLRQLLLVAWTVAALVVLGAAIQRGLLESPEMQIAGNRSFDHNLKWFSDRVADSSGALPHAWAISVPIEVYRLAMLLWALWIASAMLRWLRWGYSALSQGGLWIKAPPKPPKPSKPTKKSKKKSDESDEGDSADESESEPSAAPATASAAEPAAAPVAADVSPSPAAAALPSQTTPVLTPAAPPASVSPSAEAAPAPSASTPVLERKD